MSNLKLPNSDFKFQISTSLLSILDFFQYIDSWSLKTCESLIKISGLMLEAAEENNCLQKLLYFSFTFHFYMEQTSSELSYDCWNKITSH